jgi:hypothetical protein
LETHRTNDKAPFIGGFFDPISSHLLAASSFTANMERRTTIAAMANDRGMAEGKDRPFLCGFTSAVSCFLLDPD